MESISLQFTNISIKFLTEKPRPWEAEATCEATLTYSDKEGARNKLSQKYFFGLVKKEIRKGRKEWKIRSLKVPESKSLQPEVESEQQVKEQKVKEKAEEKNLAVIHLKDGSIVKGTIKRMTDEKVEVVSAFGRVTIDRKDVARIEFRETQVTSRPGSILGQQRVYTPKNTALAGFLSFLIPGAGQIYNGEGGKAFWFILGNVGLSAIAVLTWPHTEEKEVWHEGGWSTEATYLVKS